MLEEQQSDFSASDSTVTVPRVASTRKQTANTAQVRCFYLLLIRKDVKCNNGLYGLGRLFLYAKLLLFKLVLESGVWKNKKTKTTMEWKTQVSGTAGGTDNFLFAPCSKTGIRFATLSAGIAMTFL